MALISVIVPVYKVEPYIHRCVDSILMQSFPDFELILVDDGSPDNCGAICDDYAARDSRVRVIHQENGGLSAARNAAIDWVFANSDSRWLTFVDSDDWIHREFLQRMLAAAQKNGCALSACGIFHTAGEDFPDAQIPEAQVLSDDDFYCERSHWELSVIACGKLYDRALFETLRYPLGKLHEDEFTTYKTVYAAGQVAMVPAELYAYFKNETGIIRSQWNPRRMDALEAFQQQMAFAKEHRKQRLFDRCQDSHDWLVFDYIWKIRQQNSRDPEVKRCRKALQKKLREILSIKKNREIYPFGLANLWVYEEAYPYLPVWVPLHWASWCINRLKK